MGTGRQVIRSAEKFDVSDNCIQQWNPMESDFLASKNNYAYDEEDASIAVQGYSKYITSIPSQPFPVFGVAREKKSRRACMVYHCLVSKHLLRARLFRSLMKCLHIFHSVCCPYFKRGGGV